MSDNDNQTDAYNAWKRQETERLTHEDNGVEAAGYIITSAIVVLVVVVGVLIWGF